MMRLLYGYGIYPSLSDTSGGFVIHDYSDYLGARAWRVEQLNQQREWKNSNGTSSKHRTIMMAWGDGSIGKTDVTRVGLTGFNREQIE